MRREANIRLRVVSLSGVTAIEFVNKRLKPGEYQVNLDTRRADRTLPARAYIVELQTAYPGGVSVRLA